MSSPEPRAVTSDFIYAGHVSRAWMRLAQAASPVLATNPITPEQDQNQEPDS